MADFVTQHHGSNVASIAPWTLFFDGSSCGDGAGIGIVLISPHGEAYELSLPIQKTSTNNQAEYLALLKGITLLRENQVDTVEMFGDSLLVIKQLTREYECKDDILRVYHEACLDLLREFKIVTLEHIPKAHNEDANWLAQSAYGYRSILALEYAADDWRKEIADYLSDPSRKVNHRIRLKALKYMLLDDQLYYRTLDGVLLKCLGEEEEKMLMGEIHEGACGAHQSTFKMKWMIRNNGIIG